MKKILFCFAILLLVSACANQNQVTTVGGAKKVGKDEVPGAEGVLILHPVNNSFKGKKTTYGFFYHFPNRTLGFTDVDTIYSGVIKYLPENIYADSSLGKAVTFEINYSYPFSNFANEEKQQIAEAHGIKFDSINNYRIAKDFNIQEEPYSEEGAKVLLNMLNQNSTDTIPNKSSDARKKVSGANGILFRHPIKETLQANDGTIYYIFYDFRKKRIYISDVADMYDKFGNALPIILPEEHRNAVVVQVTNIDPFVYFKPQILKEMAINAGLKIDGGGDSTKTVNQLWVGKIAAYGIVHDYEKVIKKLSGLLKIEPTVKGGKNNTASEKKSQQSAPPVTKSTSKQPKKKNKYDPNSVHINLG